MKIFLNVATRNVGLFERQIKSVRTCTVQTLSWWMVFVRMGSKLNYLEKAAILIFWLAFPDVCSKITRNWNCAKVKIKYSELRQAAINKYHKYVKSVKIM